MPMSRNRCSADGGVGGVQRRQHEVPGERRLHRDPGGLDVADLADEDHVGVLAEDRLAARRRTSRSAASLIWIWLTVGNMYSTGSSIVITLRSFVLSSRERRVERRRLAAPGRARRRSPCRTATARARAKIRGSRRHAEVARAVERLGSCRADGGRIFSPEDRPASSRRGCRAARPSTVVSIWPSCGRRRSTMFMPAMTLMRLTSAGPMSPRQCRGRRAARRRCGPARAPGRPAARCARRTRGRGAPG